MIGILRDLFDSSVDELCDLFLGSQGTAFQTASPCIVDIDHGKIMEIEQYKALKVVREVMERTLQTPAGRTEAIEA